MIFVVVAAGALAKEEPASGEFDTASYSYGFTFDQNGYSYYPSWMIAEDEETADVAGGGAPTAAILFAVGAALLALMLAVGLWRTRTRRALALV